MSNSVQSRRRQCTRLRRPWNSPGKNVGVGCHFLLQCMKVKSESEVAQLCPTLCVPMDCSPPGSSIYGIFQARVLEWGAIALSKLVVKYIHLFCSWFCGARIQGVSHGHFPPGISWGIRGWRGNSKRASSPTSTPLSSGVATPHAWASHSVDFLGGLLSSPLAVFQKTGSGPCKPSFNASLKTGAISSSSYLLDKQSQNPSTLKGRENRFCFLMGE